MNRQILSNKRGYNLADRRSRIRQSMLIGIRARSPGSRTPNFRDCAKSPQYRQLKVGGSFMCRLPTEANRPFGFISLPSRREGREGKTESRVRLFVGWA
jgi:hypothetical protein